MLLSITLDSNLAVDNVFEETLLILSGYLLIKNIINLLTSKIIAIQFISIKLIKITFDKSFVNY